MARQSVIPQKKRGPPATGKGTPIMVRIQPHGLTALDGWIERQDDKPSRPEAIRRLVEKALARTTAPRQPSKGAARKATEMAGREIDRVLGNHSATGDERASRKRRLLSGPTEFRDMRRK
jgi:hypothetical protein